MNEIQAQALLRQLAHLNTREAANSQRLNLMSTHYKQVRNELQKLRAVVVCDFHNRENDRDD